MNKHDLFHKTTKFLVTVQIGYILNLLETQTLIHQFISQDSVLQKKKKFAVLRIYDRKIFLRKKRWRL